MAAVPELPQFHRHASAAQGRRHQHAVPGRRNAVVERLRDEHGRRARIDLQFHRQRVARRLRGIASQQLLLCMRRVERLLHGQHGVQQHDEIGPRRDGIDRIDGRMAGGVRLDGRHAGQVRAGGKAEHADARRVDAPLGGARTDHAHGALAILEWRGHPAALPRQPVHEFKRRDAPLLQPAGGGAALLARLDMRITAAADEQDGHAVRLRRAVREQVRLRHLRDGARGAVALRAGRRAAGRRTGPQHDGAGRRRQRMRVEQDQTQKQQALHD